MIQGTSKNEWMNKEEVVWLAYFAYLQPLSSFEVGIESTKAAFIIGFPWLPERGVAHSLTQSVSLLYVCNGSDNRAESLKQV